MSIHEHLRLDLTPFVNDPNLVVRCPKEWQAGCFLANMMSQYPEQTVYWKNGITHWYRYKEEHTFAPNIGNTTSRKLEYCNRDYWITKEPRPIIEFEDLISSSNDYGEINSGVESVSEFFGFQITEGE